MPWLNYQSIGNLLKVARNPVLDRVSPSTLWLPAQSASTKNSKPVLTPGSRSKQLFCWPLINLMHDFARSSTLYELSMFRIGLDWYLASIQWATAS